MYPPVICLICLEISWILLLYYTYIKCGFMKRSKNLNSGEEVKDVAYAVGYSSMNNFYKYFKLYRGETPAAFKKARIDNRRNDIKKAQKSGI